MNAAETPRPAPRLVAPAALPGEITTELMALVPPSTGQPTDLPMASALSSPAVGQQLAALEQEHGLPRLVAPPHWEADRWLLYPWLIGRDVTALVAWAQHMVDPVLVRATPKPPDTLEIRVLGYLEGVTVELVGTTTRIPLTRPQAALDLDALRAVAALEQRIADGSGPPAGPPSPAAALLDPPPSVTVTMSGRCTACGSTVALTEGMVVGRHQVGYVLDGGRPTCPGTGTPPAAAASQPAAGAASLFEPSPRPSGARP